jgi:tetratricopeptide (TPR) repeat protein
MDRSQLHRTLAEQFMAAGAAGRRELAAELALHFEEGRDYEQATRCLLRTAGNASRRFAHGDSIRVLQHALRLAPLLAAGTRIELEIQILQKLGDAHYALGAMSDSAGAYETAAAKAAEAGLGAAQIDALARLAFPAWSLDRARGNRICEQAIEVSRTLGDPLLLAQTQLAAACFRLLYDAWRKEDAEACAAAHQTIRTLRGPGVPENVFYVYVQNMQGNYEKALEQAEALMIATTNPAASLLAVGAKTLSLMPWGRFGEVLEIVRTGRELAQKNGEDPWLFIHAEAWLRALCFDFEGVRRLTKILMRSHAEKHATQPRAIAMVSAGYAELDRGRYAEALPYFAKVRDPGIIPGFFLHWRWRMHAWLGSSDAHLQAGDVANARLQVDDFLQSALSTAEPNLQALGWETKARVALAEQDSASARACIENALTIVDKFEIPVSAWRVHATAWDLYSYAGDMERAEDHRGRARELIMRIADSFEPAEPLRASLLTAAPVQRIFGLGASA